MVCKTDILIVGGGLAGLSLAKKLCDKNIDFHLVEARSRFGGRIKTERLNTGYYDMGPAWFWDGQPRIHALIKELNLTVFDQYADGVLSFEDHNGEVHKGQGYSSMAGSYRLVGGLMHLTDRLAQELPDKNISLNARVVEIHDITNGVKVVLDTANGFMEMHAQIVVLAIPPRVASQQIMFQPELPLQARQAMESITTWMAGQAKAVAVYDRPFWRDQGLSGDAMSRHGPMVEIHDASPNKDGPYALFGFIGVPVQARADKSVLRAQIIEQLGRLFGPEAKQPKELFLKDWADDPFTATHLDHVPVSAHPHYGMPQALRELMNGKIFMGSTEVAPQFGGYIEGALEASENTLRDIMEAKVRVGA